MKISIHQPEHLPWPGFFNKIKSTDLFVILDNVKFSKGYYHNRNKIWNNNSKKEAWLTIPLKKSSNYEKINKKKIKLEDLKTITYNKALIHEFYKNTKYYKFYEQEFYFIYEYRYEYLVDLNIKLIEFFLDKLEIQTELVKSSKFNIQEKKSDLILELCKMFHATEYLSGKSGINYLNLDSFKKENIKVSFQEYKYPQYLKNILLPNLSTIDMLFRLGPNAKRLI